jgi:tetratricopeptide (TPR) repeat protein
MRAVSAETPTFQALYDEAFAQLALGDYTAAQFSARRAADLALKLLQQEPEFENFHRGNAINALLLIYDTANASHNIPVAIGALEEAAGFVDKESDPLLWADVHEPLAKLLLKFAEWGKAGEILSDLIDIREEHQGENSAALAETLLLWAQLLDVQANYVGMESVSARAERIFAGQTPANPLSVAAATGYISGALHKQNRLAEAESLMKRVLLISENFCDAKDQRISAALQNLGGLLWDLDQYEEAEQLLRRALFIVEQNYDPEDLKVAAALNNLASLLLVTNRLDEGEQLLKRAVLIAEQSYGPEHPTVASYISNLAASLRWANRPEEVEALMKRSLSIKERYYGPDHPDVATSLSSLAIFFIDLKRLEEAELLMRRSLVIMAKFSAEKGHMHLHFSGSIEIYVGLLRQMGRGENNIKEQLRVVVQPFDIKIDTETDQTDF